MHAKNHPFGVRLIGFSPVETAQITAALAQAPASGPAYSCLLEASLQEPDFFIGNGDDLKAIAALVQSSPGPLQPALVIGAAAADVAFPQLPRPLDPQRLCELMAQLADTRAEAVARLSARGMPVVAERRRALRLDLDVTDPAEHAARRHGPPIGAILILDQRGALRDHIARLLGTGTGGDGRAVEWTDSPLAVHYLCEETPVALVLINTSMPAIDPYAICARIKASPAAERIAVVLLVGLSSPYDPARGAQAGVRGILDKPVADRHLLGALKRLLSLAP
jgi:CheY-like chemotaxis protein